MTNKIKLVLSVILVGIVVAFTYHIFENAVHESIAYIWDTWLGTETRRLLVIPACFVISLVFFGLQHLLDSGSETHEAKGLGSQPSPTLANYGKVLLIGYFSLLAGASLGPEAVLVPACMIAGAYVGKKAFSDKNAISLLTAAGFIALFAAFFNSFIVGFLSVFLVTKQAGIKLKPVLALVAVLASAVTVIVLHFIEAEAYVQMPDYSWAINITTLLVIGLLGVVGYSITFAMKWLHDGFKDTLVRFKSSPWWLRGLLAATGLTLLYLAGGPLVEFTGNQSIVPLFEQAASLGLGGLIWIFVIKVAAISWSKAAGYRGGLIFPTIFVAAVLVAITQYFVSDFNFIFGFIAIIIGALAADRKAEFLT